MFVQLWINKIWKTIGPIAIHVRKMLINISSFAMTSWRENVFWIIVPLRGILWCPIWFHSQRISNTVLWFFGVVSLKKPFITLECLVIWDDMTPTLSHCRVIVLQYSVLWSRLMVSSPFVMNTNPEWLAWRLSMAVPRATPSCPGRRHKHVTLQLVDCGKTNYQRVNVGSWYTETLCWHSIPIYQR